MKKILFAVCILSALSSEGQTKESEILNTSQVEKQITWKNKYLISSIETGYGDSNNGWKPAILINVKNISKEDIHDYVKVRALFYDSETNTEIGTKTKYIASKNSPFLADMNKDILLFPNIGYEGSPIALKIRVKLYIQDEFVDDIAIETVELY